MLSRLKSFIRTVGNQVTAALQVVVAQLRIRDIASRWTPRLLNRITRSSDSLRRPAFALWVKWHCRFLFRFPLGGLAWTWADRRVERWHEARWESLHPTANLSPSKVPVSLLKRIYPRTAAGLGLWAWGTFSPGKPSTLVVGGSPALGPERANKPHTIALLA